MDIVVKSRYEVCLRKDDQNMRLGDQDEQPSYVITPESLASKWPSQEVCSGIEGLFEEAKKKNLKQANVFLCEKPLLDTSILGDIAHPSKAPVFSPNESVH